MTFYRSSADELAHRLERVRRCESRSYARGWWHGAFFMLALLFVLILIVEAGSP